ncbi:MAG: leucyl/phenylalanyl-tRNA--protein transferase [Jiangellaceae bacterium]|nr:leucyl/phenylalanyl-tRNA--protein transferase [Jiangellaceae bacterium]
MPPVEPPPTRWVLPPPTRSDPDGLVGLGADLSPGTLLAAYRQGLFPMPVPRLFRSGTDLAWWSPDPRGVLPLAGLRVSRSLRHSSRRFEIRVDTVFDRVVAGCADPRWPGGWITPDLAAAYGRLHRLGWAHSVEAWTPDGRLAGGLYGVAIGGFFAGESMFHEPRAWARDASKVALVRLVDLLRADGVAGRLLDVQWPTPHLHALGVVAIARTEYLGLLRTALTLPLPAVFAGDYDTARSAPDQPSPARRDQAASAYRHHP